MNAPASAPNLPDGVESLIAEISAYSGKGTEGMIETGLRLGALKRMVKHGQFIPLIEERLGMSAHSCSTMMLAATRLMKLPVIAPFLALSKSKVIELIRLPEDELEELSLGYSVRGLKLDALPSMKLMEIRRALKVIREDSKLNDLLPLMVGDVVESRHAKRRGRAVKIYPDGSACVCWDNGEPQPEGMGHERMPRELLVRVGSVASTASEKSEMDEPFSSLVNVELPTSAVENTSRDDHGRPADAHGFASEARDLRTLIDDRLYDLMQGIRQTRTMLKMLHHYFDAPRSSKYPSVDDWSDVMDMVEVALKTLPHHYDDFYDPLEEKVSRLSKLVQDKDDGTGLDQVKRAVAETRPGV